VRVLIDGRYRERALGRADDCIKPDGVTYLDYRQAEVKARQEAANQNHIAAGLDPRRGSRTPYTVENAMEDYLSAYKRRGGKSVREFHNTIMAHVLPELGPIRLNRLTRSRYRPSMSTRTSQVPPVAPRR
jgi:hypothetical protein